MAGSNARPEGEDSPLSQTLGHLERMSTPDAVRAFDDELNRELQELSDLMTPSPDGGPKDVAYRSFEVVVPAVRQATSELDGIYTEVRNLADKVERMSKGLVDSITKLVLEVRGKGE